MYQINKLKKMFKSSRAIAMPFIIFTGALVLLFAFQNCSKQFVNTSGAYALSQQALKPTTIVSESTGRLASAGAKPLNMNQQVASSGNASQYNWAMDFCLNGKCTMTTVGTHGTLVNVPEPPISCDVSNLGKVVNNSVKINGTSKDYILACVKSTTTYEEFRRIISGPVSQSFGAVTTVSTVQPLAATTPAALATRPATSNSPTQQFAGIQGPGNAQPNPITLAWESMNCPNALAGCGHYPLLSYIPWPAIPCNEGNLNQVVQVTGVNGSTTKDYKVACVKSNIPMGDFERLMSQTPSRIFPPAGGSAPVAAASAAPVAQCVTTQWMLPSGIGIEKKCNCTGDFSQWISAGPGCYSRAIGQLIATPAPPVPLCKTGHFLNDSGVTVNFSCNCQGDFSTWAPQFDVNNPPFDKCYHKDAEQASQPANSNGSSGGDGGGSAPGGTGGATGDSSSAPGESAPGEGPGSAGTGSDGDAA